MILRPTPLLLAPAILAALAIFAVPLPLAAQSGVSAGAPLAGDVALAVLPAVAGGFPWTHGTGMTVDVGQTFRSPADFRLHAVTVRVEAETAITGRTVSLQLSALNPSGDPATGVPLAVATVDLPPALAPGVTLHLTVPLPASAALDAGGSYAFQLHFEGHDHVNDARASVLHGGEVYPGGTAYRDAGGFVSALPGDLLFLLHGAAGEAPCAGDDLTLCLRDGRFRLTAAFSADGVLYRGAAAEELTADTGWFWFFDAGNVELVSKVLDGCGANDHLWVFTAGLTDVEVLLRVVDTAAVPPSVRDYHNPRLRDFPPILDAAAFDTCP